MLCEAEAWLGSKSGVALQMRQLGTGQLGAGEWGHALLLLLQGATVSLRVGEILSLLFCSNIAAIACSLSRSGTAPDGKP